MRVEDRPSGECVADCILCLLLSRSGELRTGTGFHVRLAAAGTSERGRRCRRLHRPASIALRRRSEPAAGSSDAINFVYIADMSKNGRWPSPTIVTQLQKRKKWKIIKLSVKMLSPKSLCLFDDKKKICYKPVESDQQHFDCWSRIKWCVLCWMTEVIALLSFFFKSLLQNKRKDNFALFLQYNLSFNSVCPAGNIR